MLRVIILLLAFSSAAFAQFQRPSAAYAPLYSEWHLLTRDAALSMSSCCFLNQQHTCITQTLAFHSCSWSDQVHGCASIR